MKQINSKMSINFIKISPPPQYWGSNSQILIPLPMVTPSTCSHECIILKTILNFLLKYANLKVNFKNQINLSLKKRKKEEVIKEHIFD